MEIQENFVKYCHIGKTDNATDHNGMITLATYKDDDQIKYGVSFCSPKDRFNKKRGRLIAFNRLKQCTETLKLEELNHKSIVAEILNDILDDRNYPNTVENLLFDALHWYSQSMPEYEPELYKLTFGGKTYEWESSNAQNKDELHRAFNNLLTITSDSDFED